MSLQTTPPLRFRGKVSNWVNSFPASAKMLTIDANGDVAYQDIPVAPTLSWGNITGTLSAQTDLQAALNAKANTAHGHVIGDVSGLSSTLSAIDAALIALDTVKANNSSLANYLPLAGGTLTGSILVPVGSVGSPGIAFSTDTDTGIYSSITNTIDLVLGGATRHQFQSDGSIRLNGTDPWIYHTNFTIRSPSTGVINFRGGVNAYDATINTGAINASGVITAPALYRAGTSNQIGIETDGNGVRLKSYSGLALMYLTNVGGGVRVANNFPIGFVSDLNDATGGTFDTKLYRDGANTFAQRNGGTAQAWRVYQGYTDGSNYLRFKVDWSGANCRIGTERAGTGGTSNMDIVVNGGAFITMNSGGKMFLPNRDITFGSWNGGEVSIRNSTAFNSRLDIVDALTHSTYANLALNTLFFGGTTSSQARISRSTTTLRAQLADGSALTNFQAKLTTDTNYTAGAPTPTGYLVLYDAAGTAYKVPAEAV